MVTKQTVDVRGIVQGVGFRPAVYRLASEAGLAGTVQNRSGTVRLEMIGRQEDIDTFLAELPLNLPPNARIDAMSVVACESVEAPETNAFRIVESGKSERVEVAIPADLAICDACLGEIFDPEDRRYGYAFTTCTDCGPRYTVIDGMPYDRERTTMRSFPMCCACREEYQNPGHRRFHAETNACRECGPHMWLETPDGRICGGDPVREARAMLARGEIVAVRGIGGYLLAADVRNTDTLRRLRERKARPHKPFALMARNLDVARRVCVVSERAAALLESPERPIVILDVQAGVAGLELVTPDGDTVGLMLPTSPLHHLLCTPLEGDPTPVFDLLVMTSGNRRGEPICISNEEARARLGDVADGILMHDRDINLRNDDSLCILQGDEPQVWRRARGYAPQAVKLRVPLVRVALAMGAELKNTIALGYEDSVVLSPHVGDLETPEALDGLGEVVERLPAFLARNPDVVAVDLNPDMHGSILGRRLAQQWGVPVIGVQHHHAHAIGCLEENGLQEGLCLAFDGTGLGPDGSIWGSELLEVREGTYRRLATFAAVPLPGGDAAVRQPARQLVARCWDAGTPLAPARWRRYRIKADEVEAWEQQCAAGINAPMTHGAGRLFDAFACLLGVAPNEVTYEGQAAIRLETEARRCRSSVLPSLPFMTTERDSMMQVEWKRLFDGDLLIRPDVYGVSEWALAFHAAVADAATEMVSYAFDHSPQRAVALSGGVFMNRTLTALVVPRLERLGAQVCVHRAVPPNDGGIAFGQAVLTGRG